MLTADPGKTKLYVGVRCFNASKSSLGLIYCAANGLDTYPNWLPAEGWHELTGWFKGTGGSGSYVQPAPNPAIPSVLPVGTVWISPYFFVNAPVEAPFNNILQIDDYRIEAVSETGEVVSDTLANNIITTQKLVDAAVNEVKIATAAITTTKISDDAVTTPKLVALSVVAGKIATLAVTSDKIFAQTLSAIRADAGTLTAGIITGLLIRTGAGNPRIEMDSTKFRSIDTSGMEYFKIEPQTIGTKVYGYEFRMHPNVPDTTFPKPSMIIGGFTDRYSNVLLQSADGTGPSGTALRSWAFLVHGGSTVGYVSFGTINAERLRISEIGLGIAGRIEMSDMAAPAAGASSGVTLYSHGGGLGITTRTAVVWNGLAGPVNTGVYTVVNGVGMYLLAYTP